MKDNGSVSTLVEEAISSRTPRTSDDEIRLKELLPLIRRRWPWALAGLAIGLFAALAYILQTVPTYESRASIQIGKIQNLGSIEDLGAVSLQLMEEYGLKSGAGGQVERTPHLTEAFETPRKNSILTLVGTAYSPEEARDYLARIIAKLMKQHEDVYRNAIDPLQRRVAAIDRQIGVLSAQAAEFSDLVARLKESQPTQASVVAIDRSRFFTELAQLERDRVGLMQQATQPYSNPSKVIERPSLPKWPNKPKKLVAMLLGVLIGPALGLLAAFVWEFYVGNRRAQRKLDEEKLMAGHTENSDAIASGSSTPARR